MKCVEKEKLNKGRSNGRSDIGRYNLSGYGTIGR